MTEPTEKDLTERAKNGFLFYVIPSDIYEDDLLSAEEILLYGLISNMATRTGYCYASNAWLAQKRKVDERTVKRWLSNLEEKGYIQRDLRYENSSSVRKIFITHSKGAVHQMSPPQDIRMQGGTKLSHPQDKVVPPPQDKIAPLVLEDKVREESIPPPTPSKDSCPTPIAKKGGGPLNPLGGGFSGSLKKEEKGHKEKIFEKLKEMFGDSMTPEIFDHAWGAMTRRREIEPINSVMAVVRDKVSEYIELGVPQDPELSQKNRLERIQRNYAHALKVEAANLDCGLRVTETCVWVRTTQGAYPIEYNMPFEDFCSQLDEVTACDA